MTTASAKSCSNIAFVKYWGNKDNRLRIPVNGSISMNLAGIETTTTVDLRSDLVHDELYLNGVLAESNAQVRVSRHLDNVRVLANRTDFARVISQNNFPTGAGIASSASGFAALSVAACTAFELSLSERDLSTLSRLGSGSACRSIAPGFVEWYPGNSHESSYAESILPQDHWDLIDIVVIVSETHKNTSSSAGHEVADTSLFQAARVADADHRLDNCKTALLNRDFELFAETIEADTLLMHAVMMTSDPPLLYWQSTTIDVMHWVVELRQSGVEAAFTIDAGANVHVMTLSRHKDFLAASLRDISGVKAVRISTPGTGASIVGNHLKI